MTQNNRDSTHANPETVARAVRTDPRPRVLIAEDDDEMRRFLAKVLDAAGYAAVECRSGIDLFARLEAFVGRRAVLDFDVIISDIIMPGPTGLEILEALHDHTGFPPMILITAFGDKGTHARAKKAGAAAVLDKPFGIDELLAKLHEISPR
jgi:CheY-like chemotaxis protein